MDIKAHISNLERQIKAGKRMIAEFTGEDKRKVEIMVKGLEDNVKYWERKIG